MFQHMMVGNAASMGSKVASMSSAAQVAFTTGPILEEAKATTSKIEPRPLRLIYDWRLNRLIIINIIVSPREEPSFLKKKIFLSFLLPFLSLSLVQHFFRFFGRIRVYSSRKRTKKKRRPKRCCCALLCVCACAPKRLNFRRDRIINGAGGV